MGLVATSFYTLSKHNSIFRRFHLSYKAQKEKRPLLSQDRFLAKIAIVFSARRIPAVFLINSAPRSMRRQNASMLLGSRTQRVRFGQDLSPSPPIEYGVPQGSLLGPLLFVIHINDLPSCLKNTHISMYADVGSRAFGNGLLLFLFQFRPGLTLQVIPQYCIALPYCA